MSPAFTHFRMASIESARSHYECGDGAYLEESFAHLRGVGAVPMNRMPYSTMVRVPCQRDAEYTPALLEEAGAHKVASFRYLFDVFDYMSARTIRDPSDRELGAVKAELDAGRPIALAIRTPQAFMNLGAQILELSDLKGWQVGQHGYHAVTLVGYDDAERVFTIMNSWGRSWGEAGYGRIRYDAFNKFVLKAGVSIDAIAPPGPFSELSDCSIAARYSVCEPDGSGSDAIVTRCGAREIGREACGEDETCVADPNRAPHCASSEELAALCEGGPWKQCAGQNEAGTAYVGLFCEGTSGDQSAGATMAGRGAVCGPDRICVESLREDGEPACATKQEALSICEAEAGRVRSRCARARRGRSEPPR